MNHTLGSGWVLSGTKVSDLKESRKRDATEIESDIGELRQKHRKKEVDMDT